MKKAITQPSVLSLIAVLLTVSLSLAKIPEIVIEQKKAVVTIYIYDNDKQVAFGSGCIIDSKGIVVTNYHVIAEALKFSNATVAIKMENGEYVKLEKLIAADKNNDVALIQLKGEKFPALKLSQSPKPKQGEDIIVIGSPLGLETTVTNGIISSIRGADEFLQITAPISPGSSGSPVFNSNGEVIGIATLLIEGGQNLNFAIPVKYVNDLLDKQGSTKELTPLHTKTPAPAPAPILVPEEPPIPALAPAPPPIDYVKEIEEYTIAIALSPKDASLYNQRGNLYCIQGNYNEAIKDLTKAISLDTDNGQYYYDRYKTYFYRGQYESAIKDISKAILLRDKTESLKEYPELYSVRGRVYLKRGQFDNAFKDYSAAIKIDPEVDLVYESLNDIPPSKLKDFLKFCDKMSTLRPKDHYLYSARGGIYEELHQHDKAIKDYTKAIELRPDLNCYVYGLRGQLYLTLGNRQKAKEDFQKICHMEEPSLNDDAYLHYLICERTIKESACTLLEEMGKEEERGLKWEHFGSTNSSSFYYDKTSIQAIPNNHVRVWVRHELDNTNELLESVRKDGLSMEGVEDLSYVLDLLEFNCKHKELGTVTSLWYDSGGKVLESFHNKQIEMAPIVPDSVPETLFTSVCKEKKKERSGK